MTVLGKAIIKTKEINKTIIKTIAKLIWKVILIEAKYVFNMERIQNLVRRTEDKYGKKIAKSIGLLIEIVLVSVLYNLLGFFIDFFVGIDIIVLANILGALQIIVNKYQRNLEKEFK